MLLGTSSIPTALATIFVVSACSSPPSDTLFGSSGPSTAGHAGFGGFGLGGATSPSYQGGAGGGQVQMGGSSSSGGASYAGGFGGVLVETGGVAAFPQNTGGGLGLPPDGGPSNGGSGGTALDGSVTPPDAPFNPALCDFSGTWASYVSIDVTWPGTIVLLAGEGKLQQWNLTHEVQAPLSPTVTAHTRPCGIFLPDLQTTIFNFFQRYGIRFPDSLFDSGSIPETDFTFTANLTTTPVTFSTNAFAILIGADLADATTAAWPAVTAMTLRDDDHDGRPGITVTPVTNNGYSLPPANLLTGELADLVYIATRTVSALSGRILSCDELEADVTIQRVNGKPGIDSTVVGCRKQGGGPCAPDEASFVDGARPQFTPKAPGRMTIVRVPESTTCNDVRKRFPLQ